MPRFRNRRRIVRRRNRGGMPWYRRRYNVMEIAQNAYRGVNYLRGLVNSELLKKDVLFGSTVDSASPTISQLVALSQNDADGGRTGNSVFVRSVFINLYFTPVTSTSVPSVVTCWLIEDKQQIGDTSPSFGDIFQYTGTDGPFSPLNSATVGRFSILARKEIHLETGAGATGKSFQLFKKLRHHVRFNGTASTDVQKGMLYLVMTSNRVSPNNPSVVGSVRVSYHDN